MQAKTLAATVLGLMLAVPVMAGDAAPQVAEPYQKSFGMAWDKVNEGELPVYECIHVADIAAREAAKPAALADARQAYKLCYVDLAVRYSDTFFQRNNNAETVENGKPRGCTMYERYLRGHVVSLEARLDVLGFNAAELNREITGQLGAVPASCGITL